MPDNRSMYKLAARTALNGLPGLHQWRTLSFAGGAFPANLGEVHRDAISPVPRTHWLVWSELVSEAGALRRPPAFSDYAISSPGHLDFDPTKMSMSANIRYTHEREFLVVKGHGIIKGSATQYPGLARALKSRPEYAGPTFSAGDRYVDRVAAGREKGSGNATTWRWVGTDHHLGYVVDQIAKTLSP